MTEPRCEWSDLPTDWCAHCHPDRTTGRMVWDNTPIVDAGRPVEMDETPLPFVRRTRRSKRPSVWCYRTGTGDDAEDWLRGHHTPDCEPEGCRGCVPCTRDHDGNPTVHCPTCRSSAIHLTYGEQVCAYCVGDVRADLTGIETTYAMLPDEALANEYAGATTSEAAVLAGPAADVDVFHRRQVLSARGHQGLVSHHDQLDPHHPLIVLGQVELGLRDAYGPPTTARVTVSRAVAYIDHWLTRLSRDPDQDFDDLARRIRHCRAHLETVVHDSQQTDRGAPCPRCPHDDDRKPPRLMRHHTDTDKTGASDRWVCPLNPAHWWTEAEYRLRVGEDHLRHADRLTADQMHQQWHIKPSTLRTWVDRGQVRRRGRDQSGRQLYDVAQARATAEEAAS